MSQSNPMLCVADQIAVARRLRDCFFRPGAPEQKVVANNCSVPESTLSQWLAGKIPKGAVEVTQVACALGLRPDELYLASDCDQIRMKASDAITEEEAEALDGLCQEAVALTEFTGPAGLRILKEHCAQLAAEFKRLSHVPAGTVISKPEPKTRLYDAPTVAKKMRERRRAVQSVGEPAVKYGRKGRGK